MISSALDFFFFFFWGGVGGGGECGIMDLEAGSRSSWLGLRGSLCRGPENQECAPQFLQLPC